MIRRWIRILVWKPFALISRRFPLWPFRTTITQPADRVTCIRIDNLITRLLSRLGGGYDYAVCYLVDKTLLIDTGFPWARRNLKKALADLGADTTIKYVVNTHYHEDHTGNNDLLDELCDAQILAHAEAVPEILFPIELPWYRSFLFGPSQIAEVGVVGPEIATETFRFDVIDTPGQIFREGIWLGHSCVKAF